MEHWKKPDKGRHQHQHQQQPQNQNQSQKSQISTSTTSDHSAIIQQTDPIQSIANVLNHHHGKLIQHQKKSQQLEEQAVTLVTENKLDQEQQESATTAPGIASSSKTATPQDSNLSTGAFSHSSNQIDQGNSYLYAYNDFVTSTTRAQTNDVKLACKHKGLSGNQRKEIEDNGGTENHRSILCEHIPALQKSSLNFELNQESLIDSDEDDALSYILHQHRPQSETRGLAAFAGGNTDTSHQGFLISNHPSQYLQYEDGNNLEAQRIEHHLSCSRSSHPRHICGIGGSQNDNLNSIAVRLREESQRAFELNQKSRRVYQDNLQHHNHHHHRHRLTSNDIAAIQSHQFTHDLTIIQDQLANASVNGNSQLNKYNQEELLPGTSYNNLNNTVHLSKLVTDRKNLLLSDSKSSLAEGRIINNSSSSSLNEHSQSETLTRAPLNHTRQGPGFLSWLFCCLCHLLSPTQATIQQSHTNTNARKRRHKISSSDESTSAVGMYSATQQMGQLGGQAGAYYTTQTPQADALHQAYSNHAHHPHHQHHYPMSSDSSMGSSVFATSALRMNAFFRSCCSKKCLFISCLALILLIFILVISLSAYLNFLINLNKTNLTPLSGRLKVETSGDTFIDQLSNRTSKEFLAKQQQYETILRGAFDRTQNLLKSYPNHLVKCEVYSFKQGSLWIYFRLFINKRTLMQDTQLMKRKSPDEHLDKQFLPRITQQTLHSGFEQLMNSFNRSEATVGGLERRSRSSQVALLNDALRHTRTFSEARFSSQRDHVKSFDDQISRLMPIIESIDLQSITVTPEFDMLQSSAGPTLQEQSMSDNLRASQFLTTSTSSVMVATGPSNTSNNNKNSAEYDPSGSTTTENHTPSPPTISSKPTTLQPNAETEISPTGSSEEINVSTRKFVLYGYKENTTRPTTSSRPSLAQESTFLVEHQQRKPVATSSASSRANALNIIPSPGRNNSNGATQRQSSTLREIASSRAAVTVADPTSSSNNNKRGENAIKLITDQPGPVSNNNLAGRNNGTLRNADDGRQASANNKNVLVKQDKSPGFANNFSTTTPELTTLDSAKSISRKDKGVNETVLSQMVAPYQKIDFSVQPPQRDTATNASQQPTQRPKDTSVEELWDNALGKRNTTTSRTDKQNDGGQSSQPKRLITVTTIGESNLNSANNSGLDWHKISVLSSEISNTIRANMHSTRPTTILPPSSTSSVSMITPPSVLSNPKPKVSPHLMHGGSLMSTPIRPNQQQSTQHETHSAVVLNRDFAINSNDSYTIDINNNSTQHQGSVRSRLDKPRKFLQSGGGQRNVTLPKSTTVDSQKQNPMKPTVKPHKPKKVGIEGLNNILRNDSAIAATTSSATAPSITTTTNSAVINSKGIKIVDHFLASLDSNRAAELLSQNLNNSSAINLRQNKNKTQETFNYNADLIIPTLPATIELTRSTTSLPPARTTSFHPLADGWTVGYKSIPGTIEHSTTPSSTSQRSSTATNLGITTDGPFKLGAVTDETQTRPKSPPLAQGVILSSQKPPSSTPTSSFSSQWKPITLNANNSSSAIVIDESWIKNRTSTRRPNISLIVNNDKLLPIVNVLSNQGSQSPFAMSTSILENQLRTNSDRFDPFSQQVTRRPNRVFNGNFPFHAGSGNEFESHRMSRMRLGDTSVRNPSSIHLSSSSTTTGLSVESNTRVVDDFMITTDKSDSGRRGSTLAPPSQIDPHRPGTLTKFRSVSNLDLQPKRTRGPFAFETLKSVSIASPAAAASAVAESIESAENPGDSNLQQQRSERSSSRQQVADQRLLLRKKLFLGNGEDDELKAQTTTISPLLVAEIPDINKVPTVEQMSPSLLQNTTSPEKELDQFGDRHRTANLVQRRPQPPPIVDYQPVSTSHSSNLNTFKCQYYGCKAKSSMKFICLNHTQICDDFIDCHDESDELDCVSMLKHDSKTNQLSFSNGGGIIYLNRKGSLAPMCIDYFTESENRLTSGRTNAAHDLDAIQLEMIKKQQELIRQINTIGQYACSLQSFSRLVSVKINHHDLVDSMNLIKTSKLFHRLSIVGGADKHSSDAQFGSYKSATSEHEVEVSTSTDCPSQRTVFVKCGSFECGQDSFSVIDRNSTSKRKDGVIINDFPWLVKLYWLGSLSCHGYLIDELWLISSSECFVNKSRASTDTDEGYGWTAEISYEHYGNDDYQSIESNRRSIKEILVQPYDTNKSSLGPAIVLAKLEKPVRFSPLNRPICLPLSAMNKTSSDMDRMYKDCVTATLPLSGSVSPTQDLLLNKVKVHKSTDCLTGELKERLSDDLICVADTTRNDGNSQIKEHEATRVLICSSSKASRSRSKWTVVGVQSKAQGLRLDDNKQLFTTVSSQIDWIVDTMNPKSYHNLGLDGNNSDGNELNPLSAFAVQSQTCNRFKCSSGECLSWSRICDGLYDCSSHEDEKDCHK